MSAHVPQRRSFMYATSVVCASMTLAATTASAAEHSGRAHVGSASPGTEAHLAAAAPANSKTMMLGGFSSKGWPVVMEFTRNLKRIHLAAIGLDMTCTSGDQFAVTGWFGDLPVGPNGKVQTVGAIPPQAGSNGVKLSGGSESLSGRLNRTQLTFTGSWRMQLNYTLSNNQSDQCDSGQVAFSARL
ncbi:MAG TPA: hypothetical protein VMU39_29325 [Solirubrobacteraceae bacterium]|nr:hypothetical protein [Solirubrobacteraceae bacterium]